MNKIRRLVAKFVPTAIKKRRRDYLNSKQDKKENENLLAMYESIIGQFPHGFVALNPYVKTEKIFDGVQYYSQFYQDYFLDKHIFNKKDNGVFLDIGGNDPIYINNTYFFEKERNWTGLAFEPMPKMAEKWAEYRRIPCINKALGSSKDVTEFCEYAEDYMSGLSSNVDYNGEIINRYQVEVSTLCDELSAFNINQVDFMSIDVEGAELDVLKGIDFGKVRIDYIVIENNKGNEKERVIREYLIKNNYILIARLWIDDVWKRKE